MIYDANRDPKKGKKYEPSDFNPWEAIGQETKKIGIPLKSGTFSMLKGLTRWRKS